MQRARVRPDPVSCRSCRSKKLKCNRVQPCSNCVARSIVCNFQVPPQRQQFSSGFFDSNAELLRRIGRLESILLKQTAGAAPLSPDTPDDSHVLKQQPLSSSSEGGVATSFHHIQDQASYSLENIGIRDDSLLPHLSNGLAFRISSNPVADEIQRNGTPVTFPSYKIASLLIQSYESSVDHFCPIVHIPMLRTLIKTCYLRFNQDEAVLPGQAALLLSVFAIAAYFYHASPGSEVATTKQHALQLSKIFSKHALDVLDCSSRDTSRTLEDVQAYILMSFVAYHLDGYSARYRTLSAAATSLARELGLHQVDAASASPESEDKLDLRAKIDREIKRRVFWHVASTDWLLSTLSGPQEGSYFIHPSYVRVMTPKDCTDDDILLTKDHEATSDVQPTSMTFFLERLRLAHLSREMTDIVPLETCKLMELPYDLIMTLDKKLEDYISELPFFFKLDPESRSRTQYLETIYPRLAVSRYCINAEALSRRCKLHQKFLLRQSVDAKYAYSRRACLESARTVVYAYEGLRGHESLSTVPELMGIAVHFTHLALVVMVMDLCFNRNDTDEAEIEAEVKRALQMFGDTDNASPLLHRFLTSLNEVLQKHNVRSTESSTVAPGELASSANEAMFDDTFDNAPLNDNHMRSGQLQPDYQRHDTALDLDFDEFWQNAMQGEINPDLLAWDNLFSAADSRP